jgi:hypothetical protein
VNKKEIAEALAVVFEQRGISRKEAGRVAGITDSNVIRFIKHHDGMSMSKLMELLDAHDMEFIIVDKDVNWGLDVRLRVMPKKLYVGERIESRSIVRQEGFHSRVDLFETPEAALNFYTKPCDVYEIFPHKLIRKQFDVIDHPLGTMYSYNDWISPDYIENRVTYR